MRLSRLILTRKDSILLEFEDFARTHTSPGEHMDVEGLRDHASAMLDAFAKDLEEPQSEDERRRKSRGDKARDNEAAATAAEQHGTDRAGSGFSLAEMFAEYRALRASVIRHWMAERDDQYTTEIDDLIRFNEAIDQAVAESITRYAAAVGEYRDMFLAMLGHDLRTPLNAILAASGFLAENGELAERDDRLARSIRRSGQRMGSLIEDMLDFTSTQLGRGIPLNTAPVDMRDIVREAVEEMRMTHRDHEIQLETDGPLPGEWDESRVRQAIANLLDNAVQHASDTAITVSAHGGEDEVRVDVHNFGSPIPAEDQQHIFDPFRRANGSRHKNGRGDGLGLGLYIARQIVAAHGGRLDVKSADGQGTTFSLYLPRTAATRGGAAPMVPAGE